jgi:hypothetical protein
MSMSEQDQGLAGVIPTESLNPHLTETEPSSYGQVPENAQWRLDSRLDQALEHTFPASDPVAILIEV